MFIVQGFLEDDYIESQALEDDQSKIIFSLSPLVGEEILSKESSDEETLLLMRTIMVT